MTHADRAGAGDAAAVRRRRRRRRATLARSRAPPSLPARTSAASPDGSRPSAATSRCPGGRTSVAATYTVAFSSIDLWGEGGEPPFTVVRRPLRGVPRRPPARRPASLTDHDHAHHETPGSRRARSEFELRTMALEAALGENGRASTDAIDAFVEHLEHRMGPHHGARVVARAWVDPAFKAAAARRRHGGDGRARHRRRRGRQRPGRREHRPTVHNLVVCTLCSCYPWPLLGVPPIWYKSFAYRSRAVAEPRAVLREFGCSSWPTTSRSACGTRARRSATSCCPPRPAGTEDLDEDELAALVTRDAMIGVRRRSHRPCPPTLRRGGTPRPRRSAGSGPRPRNRAPQVVPARQAGPVGRRQRAVVVVEERVRQQHVELLVVVAVEHPEPPRRRRAVEPRRGTARRGGSAGAGPASGAHRVRRRSGVLADAQVEVAAAVVDREVAVEHRQVGRRRRRSS